MAPCNQEMKRRYAPLDGASEGEGRLNPRQGGFPRRERPWAAVIPKRLAAEASWVRRKAIFNGRKLRRAFSDLFLSFTKEKTSMLSASVSAQAKEKAYLVQVRTFYLGERTCQGRLHKGYGSLRPQASSSCVPGHRPAQASSSLARGGSPLSGHRPAGAVLMNAARAPPRTPLPPPQPSPQCPRP